MGRKRKYSTDSKVMSFVLPDEMVKTMEELMEEHKIKTKSEFILQCLKIVLHNKHKFCKHKAKMALQDFHYWKSRAEFLESDGSKYD